VPTRRVQAAGDQALHPEAAHVAERHRLAGRVPQLHPCVNPGTNCVSKSRTATSKLRERNDQDGTLTTPECNRRLPQPTSDDLYRTMDFLDRTVGLTLRSGARYQAHD
jgi:hypothetical protein